MLMYTSCGWFFDEISGLEPVQILKYAAIVMQYLRDLGGPALEPELERRLAAAPSNVVDFAHGAEVYRRLVAPLTADLRRIVAHYAITGLFTEHPDEATVYAYRVERLDETRRNGSSAALRIAQVRVESVVTGEAREVMYALLHVGGHDVTCALRAWEGQAAYNGVKADLLDRHARDSVADVVRGIDEHFPGETFGLPHLFLDERRRVLAAVTASVLAQYEETYREIWEESRGLVRYLRRVDAPIPDALALVARHVLEQEVGAAARSLDGLGALPPRMEELLGEAHALGLNLNLTLIRPALEHALACALDGVAEQPTVERIDAARRLVADTLRLGLDLSLWGAQNRYFEIWRARAAARPALEPLGEALGFALDGEVDG
jgi:hypothetical protein